jgi:hypothetical protein
MAIAFLDQKNGLMDPCLFCGSTAGAATLEDVIPKWARRAFAADGPVTVRAADEPDSPWRDIGRPKDVLKIALKGKICASCNNAWLGGSLEKSMARLLAPMAVQCQPVIVDAAAQRLVAFWATKTVLLLELALRQMLPGLRPVEGYVPSQAELAWMRQHNKPHWRTMVWLGCYDCEKFKRVVYEPSAATLRGADGAIVPAHMATFALGYLAFQVFSVDFLAAEQQRAEVWNTKVPKSLASHLVRIWPEPLVRPDVSWPPEQFGGAEWRRLVTWDGVLRPNGINAL